MRYPAYRMARRSPESTISSESSADRLLDAVIELADNVRILTDIVDQVREDLSWLTRNGIPHQPLVVHVQRMPGVGAGERSSFEFSLQSLPAHDPTAVALVDDPMRARVVDEVVEHLADPLGRIAQEQLNILLSVLDHAHRDLLRAIRCPQPRQQADESPTRPRRRRKKSVKREPEVQSSADIPSSPPAIRPPSGQLF